MPFVWIDTQRDVDLDVLNATYISRNLPRELIVGMPGSAHAQECRMRDGLRVCGDSIMLLSAEMDDFGLERREDTFNKLQALVRGSVLDQDLDLRCYHRATGIL